MAKRSMTPPAAAPRRGSALTEEERRRNRMTSNRLSARKSRMKRQQHEEDLAAHASQLKKDNDAMRGCVGVALRQCSLLEQENRVLMAHARELCSVLQLRNSQLRLLGEVANVPLDVPEVSGHLVHLYGGLQMPLLSPPPPPLPLPLPLQILLQLPDVMDACVYMDAADAGAADHAAPV